MYKQHVDKLIAAWKASIGTLDSDILEIISDWFKAQPPEDFSIICRSIESISVEHATNKSKFKSKPNLTDLRLKVREMKEEQNPEQSHSEPLTGCAACGHRGLFPIVMAQQANTGRMIPVLPGKAIPTPLASVSMHPCNCPMGQNKNNKGHWHYSPMILDGLQIYRYDTSTLAWQWAAECMKQWQQTQDQTELEEAQNTNRFQEVTTL